MKRFLSKALVLASALSLGMTQWAAAQATLVASSAMLGLSSVDMQERPCTEKSCHHRNKGETPDVLYEMVPNIVLPKSIQYKPMPTSITHPGTYGAYTSYPATYTAYPSYVLPYPTEMRTIGEAVYPITPAMPVQPAPVQYAAYQPYSTYSGYPTYPGMGQPALYYQAPQTTEPEQPLLRPALPDGVQPDETENAASELGMIQPIGSDFSQGRYTLVQYSPLVRPAVVPTPDPNANPVISTPAGPITLNYAQPQAANPVAPANPAVKPPIPATSSQVSQEEVLRQIQQLLDQNPNLQISAVMMGPNGQVVPMNSANGVPQSNQLQMQQLAQQMQYVQAMNQHVQQYSVPKNACGQPIAPYGYSYGYGAAPYGYAQPMQGYSGGAVAMPNPYYPGYAAQGMPGGYAQPMSPYGYGVMPNPYYPMPQQAAASHEGEKTEKGIVAKMQERRLHKEKQLCDAWRAPYYPENTGMRLPSKSAYPWGYFGAQVGPSETANFGGYNNMYFGTSTCPGQ